LWNISERRKIIFADLHWKNNPAPFMHKDLEENERTIKDYQDYILHFFKKVSMTLRTQTGVPYYNRPCNVKYHNVFPLFVT